MVKILNWAILPIVLAGCSTNEANSGHAKPAAAAFDTIVLQRTACYGACPIYTVAISADGTSTYTGEKFVKVEGVRRATVSQADIALLSSALKRTTFDQLRTTYVSEADGCKDPPTDLPSLSISVTTSGQTRKVSLYAGCRGPSVPAQEIAWIAETIDMLAHTERLVY